MDGSSVALNLREVLNRVRRRCLANGTDPADVKIVGVTKSVSPEIAGQGVRAGLTDLGENRIQEASEKIPRVSPRPIWHFIGHLQKNKAKKAVEIFDIIESIDSLELARLISKKAGELGKTTEVYLQVNSSQEKSKSGFDPREIFDFADTIYEFSGLKVTGLMTIGPLTDDENLIEKSFALTRDIFDKLRDILGDQFKMLSMGMSGDYELALDYGANVLRIGTAIFGRRSYDKAKG